MNAQRLLVLVMMIFLIILSSCENNPAKPPANNQTVTTVVVAPNIAVMLKGTQKQFTVEVRGTNNPPQTVRWEVFGGNSENTNIGPTTGLLTVANDETSVLLSVIATSTHDPLKSSVPVPVTITEILPTVDSVVVSPDEVDVNKGSQLQFSATVHGEHNPPQNVYWEVSGGNSTGTEIGNTSGLLTVANNETATILTVKASSVIEPTVFGTASVTVLGMSATIERVEVSPTSVLVMPGMTQQQFSAVVYGANNPSQAVEWSVTGNTHSGTSISSSGLLTGSSLETASILTVKATSTVDRTKFGTAEVYILGNMESIGSWVYIGNSEIWVTDTDGNDTFMGYSPSVHVALERGEDFPFTSEPTVVVRVNNILCQLVETYFNTWGYDGFFEYSTLFSGGTTYDITLTVNGETTSGSVSMPFTPNVTHPPTFIPTQDMTFNWTLSANSMLQMVDLVYWDSILQDELYQGGPIDSSLRHYVVPANTVPSSWVNASFGLGEFNVAMASGVGVSVLVGNSGYWEQFENEAMGARTHHRPDRDNLRKKQQAVLEYLKKHSSLVN